MEQGTILDRIDYNIENAKTSVKEGHINKIIYFLNYYLFYYIIY